MCVLCNELITKVHWSDTVAAGQPDAAEPGFSRRRERHHRTAVLNRILQHYGLSIRDWNGVKFVLSDKKGQSVLVHDFGDLWPAVERLCGRRPDPLDGSLLAALAPRKGGDDG